MSKFFVLTAHVYYSLNAAYYPLVMGLWNAYRDMRLATVVSGVSLKLKITPAWMEPDSHHTQSYSVERDTHTHTFISACDWKPKPFKKAEGQGSFKQVVCAGKLPSEVFSEESRRSECPSFKFTSSTGNWDLTHTNCFLSVSYLARAMYNGFLLMEGSLGQTSLAEETD